MNRALRLASLAVIALALVAGVWLSFSPSVHAQVGEGLTAVGETVRLSSADPRVIAARIINVFLGLLSIIFLGLTVYAGFLWMTSGGDSTKTGHAMTLLRNAVIGLIIILSSWAITRYVISHLLDATSGGGGGAVVDESGGGSGFGSGGAFSNFQLRSITPVGSIPIRNVRVHFVFSRNVDPVMASSTIHVYRASGRVPVEGTLSVSGAVVVFIPSAVCPTAPTERCLDGDTDFIAVVDRTLRSLAAPGESSLRIVCGGFALSCEASFRTGNLIDTLPPTATIQIPYEGQSIAQDDIISVSTRAVDDVAISYVSSSVNGSDIGVDAPTSTTAIFTSAIDWSTRGTATGTYSLRSQASDLSGHYGLSSALGLIIRPAHCSNHRQDEDEAAPDCGGRDCAICVAPPIDPGAPPRAAHCSNRVRDEDEVAIDCGGSTCPACVPAPDGSGAPHCSNGSRDADELGIDCGGSCLATCTAAPVPAHCRNGSQDADETGRDCGGRDCAVCTAAPVPAHCSSGTRDADETGVDCGGSCPATCVAPSVPAHCSSGTRDADETGVDCGGSCPATCIAAPIPPGTTPPAHCRNGSQDADETGRDCGGRDCTACVAAPVPAHCRNGSQDADETGRDCGGRDCTACVAAPVPAHCSSGTRDADETGVDCGGSCPATCVAAPVPAHCSSGTRDADETGVDCGGSCPATCVAAPVPDHCRNGSQDADETGRDCGGTCPTACDTTIVVRPRCPLGGFVSCCGTPGFGACPGDSCTSGIGCSTDFCVYGRCVEQPVILSVSPGSGRPGTLVTISGTNFGATRGQVRFWGGSGFTVLASAPTACVPADTWRPGQIIVQVPVGAVTGPIQVTNVVADRSDATNDTVHPPILDNFIVNTIAHPGLCAVAPITGERGDAMTLTGIGLGTTPGQVWFGTDPRTDRNVTPPSFVGWSDTRVAMNVPVVPVATYAIHTRVGGQDSNTVGFTVTERVRANPVIDTVDPDAGPIGEYLTLTGRNFGVVAGQVFFRNTRTGEIGAASDPFPAACVGNSWHDTSVTVKVPSMIGLARDSRVTEDRYQLFVRRNGDGVESNRVNFTVNTNPPHPGLCAITPVAGPVGASVSLVGERFGSRVDTVTFQGSTPEARVRAGPITPSSSWTPETITTSVPGAPSTAYSGPVRVTVGSMTSNPVPFAVRNCNEDARICGTETCCRDSGACSIRGVCSDVTLPSMFGWELSTGQLPLYPEVLEECPGRSGLPPSPSPWDGRPGGAEVCVNAQIVIRFNTGIDRTTLNDRTVIVNRCTATGDNPCATVTRVRTRRLTVGDSDGTGTSRRTIVTFSPDGEGTGSNWVAGTTYQVLLTTGIISDGRIAMRPLERCGAGNGYCFRFVTRASTELCRIGSVGVTPNPFTATDIDQVVEPYIGHALSENDVCIQINPDSASWRWYTGVSSMSDARASLMSYTGSECTGTGGCPWMQRAIARNETGPTDPVPINTEASNPGERPAVGTAPLYIQFIPPRVISYGPNCNEACSEATIWAEFNVPMDPASVGTRQALLYKCTNENCRTFRPSTPLVLGAGSVTLVDSRTASLRRPADRRLRIAPIDGSGLSYLEPGAFYKIILLADTRPCGGPRLPACVGLISRTGLSLTGLNDRQGFAWRFRVKESNGGLCDVTRVDVLPVEKVETVVAARQLFSAAPVSVSEACGEQFLMDSGTPYDWTNASRDVSKFINGRGDGLMSYARVLSRNCSGRCLNLGSEGVWGRLASCGNSKVETTDMATAETRETSTCRRPSGAICTPTDADCVVRTDPAEFCKILLPGSEGGEECDLGALNGVVGGVCGADCLWRGVEGGTCGNGRVDLGEQCDPGRVCVGGTAAGTTCVRDDGCAGGGRCLVNTVGTGCSDHCLALGASSVTGAGEDSQCGNRSVGAGEACDDGNMTAGDGCSPDCLHEGSHTVVAVCGNTIVEPGESCEVARSGSWPRGCNHTTCLNEGTDACPVRPLSGELSNCCGNGVRSGASPDPGEDCDDGNNVNGDGCSSRCLLEGSSIRYRPAPSMCGDTVTGTGEQCEAAGRVVVGGRQISEIVGEHEPDTSGRMMSRLSAVYRERTGQADHGLQCGFSHEIECVGDPSEGRTIRSHGLTTSGCCMERPTVTAVRFPLPDATNVCRNTEISFNFNQVMDEGSISDGLVIGEEVTGACPAGTTALTGDYSHTCVGQVVGTVRVEPAGRGTRAIFALTRALHATTTYRIIIRGDSNLSDDVRSGVRNARGVLMAGDVTWMFTTNDRICLANTVVIRDTNPDHPFLFQRANESHPYSGSIMSIQAGIMVPISSVEEYGWTWQPWLSSRTSILATGAMETMTVADTVSQRASTSTVRAFNRTGSSLIFAGIRIVRDTVSIPPTVGQTIENSHIATVAICERPWPFADARYGGATLFSDSRPQAGEPSVLTGTIFASGPYHNVASLYCMDAGQGGTSVDDLLPLTIRPTPPSASDIFRGILRQYLFTFEGTGVSDVLRKDAIGMRIFENPLHLSPRAWYLGQGFSGAPASMSIDGYEAIRDGDNTYVGAPNVENSTTGPVTSTIYLLSHNPDAERQTKSIFDQLVENLVFNVNIERDSSNVCMNGTTVFEDERHRVVPCSSDWECAKKDMTLRCASFKAKIQRDIQRLADFQTFMTKLEDARTRDGRYPAISDGSYLQGLTNSRWGSWQSVLGAAIGGDPPIDPVNRFLTCGRCRYTESTVPGEPCVDTADCRAGGTCDGVPRAVGSPAAYDPSTCWEVTNRRFICPRLPSGPSRFYQYRALGAGAGYELGTELEAASYDRYRPPLVTGLRRCTNTGQLCQADDACITYFSGTTRERSRGRCQPIGGQWRYTNVCTGTEFGVDTVCGNGVRSTTEACEVNDTATASCVTADGRPGMKQQVCAPDCQRFTDGPSTHCIPLNLCGNGRVDRYLCNGPGVKYGQACSAPTTGASPECSDPRDPTGSVTMCVSISSIPSAGSEEVCDDGAALNGTYGHCSRTCTGYDDRCGDGQLSLGEMCDNGDTNGQYCDTRPTTATPPGAGCIVAGTCGFDCRSRAPFCGDSVVQEGSGEQCELGQSSFTTDAICGSGHYAPIIHTGPFSITLTGMAKSCQSNADCTLGAETGVCGHVAVAGEDMPADRHFEEDRCTGYMAQRCVGAGLICQNTHQVCSSDADCNRDSSGWRCVPRNQVDCSVVRDCGQGGRCNGYATHRVRSCGPSSGIFPVEQCQWGQWSACLPAASCGDGMVNPGETCDDGNDIDNDRCTSQCQTNVCGDGYLNVGVERCDYGDVMRGGRNGLSCSSEYGSTCATCTTSCHVEAQSGGFCGDGIRNGREVCDYVGACEGGTSVGARCTSDTVCGTGGRCSFPGVSTTSTCRGIGYDYANNSTCDTNAYITETGGGVVCVRASATSDECTTCALTVGMMSRPLRPTARLACVGDDCTGGPTGTAGTGGGTGTGDVLRYYTPGPSDVTTPGGFGTHSALGVYLGGVCRACRGGDCVYHPPSVAGVPVRVTLATQATCRPDTIHDFLSCGTSCGLSGCGSCLVAPTPENAITIQGEVYDSFAQVPIPGARVILTYRGNQIADTVADAEGRFLIPNLHGRRECGQYRLTVSQERDNPRTPALETFGYRSFDSGSFTPVDFMTHVTIGGRIELAPRTGEGDTGRSGGGLLANETRVIVTWTGSLPTFSFTGEDAGRYVRAVLPHVILPESRKFHKGPPTTVGGTLTCHAGDEAMACALFEGRPIEYPLAVRDDGTPPLLCSDRTTVYNGHGEDNYNQFACGYMYSSAVTGGRYYITDPLSRARSQGMTGQDSVLCCPKIMNFRSDRTYSLGDVTPAGTMAIREYLTSTGQPLTDAAMAMRAAAACCTNSLELTGYTIIGYATSTACRAATVTPPVAAEPACSSNASPSNYCCRRDIGSGATWQGSNDILRSPGAVVSCKPHLITTREVCTEQERLSPTGPVRDLACNPNSTCDEFVREASPSDPMRIRYMRSMLAGDTYSFYLEQAHYAESELGGEARITRRCWFSGTLSLGGCGEPNRTVECNGTPSRCVETTSGEHSITCSGAVDTCIGFRSGDQVIFNIHTPAPTDIRATLSAPSVLLSSIGLQVEILNGTTRTIIRPGSGARSCPSGINSYLWHAFDQDAVTGEITIPGDGVTGEWVCDAPEGMTGLNRLIVDSSYRFPGSYVWPRPELGDPPDPAPSP